MFDRLGSWVNELREWVAGFEPGVLDGAQAVELLGVVSEGERLFGAARMLLADRVADTGEWQRGGARSAADWLARQTKTDAFRARAALEAAGRFGAFPLVAAEVRAGRLSESQAHLIVDAAGASEGAERHLVDYASQHSVRRLAEECRRLKTVAEDSSGVEDSRYERRELKTWKGRNGSLRGSFELPAEAGALAQDALDRRVRLLDRAARAEGRQEPFTALAADALLELLTEDRGAVTATDLAVGPGGAEQPTGRHARRRAVTRPQASVVVHVDYEALMRGAVEGDEVCMVEGVGPIPVAVARRLLDDCVLYLLIKQGGAPYTTTPGKRTIPHGTRLKVEAQDGWRCAVPGCDETKGLHIHHIRWFSKNGDRTIENLVLVCRRHHDRITYQGWTLTGPAAHRVFRPPGGEDWMPDPNPPPEMPIWSSPWAPSPGQATLAPA